VKVSIARLILFALLLCGLLAFAAGEEGDAARVDGALPSPVERLRGLAEVWGMVHYFHPALDDPGLQDAWKKAAMQALPAVESAEDAQEYARALQGLVALLGDAYTQIVWSGLFDSLWGPPINLSFVNGKTIVRAVGDDTCEWMVGLELLEVDGQSVAESLEAQLPLAGGETEALKREWVYGQLLSGAPGGTISLLLADAAGTQTIQTMSVPTADDFLSPAVGIESEMTADDVLWVRIPSLLSLVSMDGLSYLGTDLQSYYGSLTSIHRAAGIVIDFRTLGHAFATESLAAILLPQLLGQFAPNDGFRAAGVTLREHRGYAPVGGQFALGTYTSGWRTENGPVMSSGLRREIPLVFVVDSKSYPFAMPYLAALQEAGVAVVMGEAFGTAPFEHNYLHELPGGLTLALRLSVVDCADEDLGMILVDSPKDADTDTALDAACATIASWDSRSLEIRALARPLGAPLRGVEFSSWASNAQTARLFGLFELWNAIRYFYPYPEMIDGDLGDLLEEFIAVVEQAASQAEYAEAIQEFLVHLHDGHGMLLGHSWGTWPIPQVEIAEVEDTAVAVSPIPIWTEAGTMTYLPTGHEILEINGVPVEEVLDDILRISPGAREEYRRYRAFAQLLWDVGSGDLELLIKDFEDEEMHVDVCTKCQAYIEKTESDDWWIEEDIAYLDICSLEVSQYQEIEERVRASAGLIIDLRGYPTSGMFSAIAELVFSQPTPYLQSSIPVRSTPDPSVQEMVTSWPELPILTEERFEGPIVVLTNVSAGSAAETMCMFLQDGVGAALVGETTSGTNGNVTEVELPYGLSALFSGMAIHHVDGRPFQGIGIIPDVEVHPTIQGIRDGRDEVLEKGLEVLREMMETHAGSE